MTLGAKPDELIDPVIPEAGEFIHNAFWELFEREHGVSWQAIYHYQLLYDIEFSGGDIAILRALSAKATAWLNKREKPATAKPPNNNNKSRSRHAPKRGRG